MKYSLRVRLALPAVLLVGVNCGWPLCAAQSPTATATLLEKAHELEGSGRADLAVLTWQQVLLIDPQNSEASAGLARAAKLSARREERKPPPERVRPINPTQAHPAGVEERGTQERADLDRAAQLAAGGQYAQAMSVYRAILGATPPPRDMALAYYETEAALDEGRSHAVAGLRGLAEKYPGDARYQIALGRVLTYDPRTRNEGRRLLQRFPQDAKAVEGLRQSLVWDARNPASTADLRAYLARHPDPQLAQSLQPDPVQAQEPAEAHPLGKSHVQRLSKGYRESRNEEESAFRELKSGDIGQAERRFRAILVQRPQSGAALAGMGYLELRHGNFGGAISFLTRAQQVGVKDARLDSTLNMARFRYTLSEAQEALAHKDLSTARRQFEAAFALRPNSPEVFEGLGRTLFKERQPRAAMSWFERLTRAQPNSAIAWVWLMEAQEQAGEAMAELATERSIPPSKREKLMREPEFLRLLVSAYSAAGRDPEAQQMLHAALDLPFPPGALGIEPEKQVQYAKLLQQAKRFDQADGLYRQVLAADGANTAAWKGLLEVEHTAGRREQAMATLAGMPSAAYTQAMEEPGFDVTVSAILLAAGKPDKAQEVLERSIAQNSREESGATFATGLQLARIHLERGHPELAYSLAQKALAVRPNAADAWEVLLASLHASGRDQEVFVLVQQLSPDVRTRLESMVDYMATMAAAYRALGQNAQADTYRARLKSHDAQPSISLPVEAVIEDARMLLNAGDEPGLYRQLLVLDASRDANAEQRHEVQTLWAGWAAHRASQAAAGGDRAKAIALLDTASGSFPDNRAALLTLAGAYTQAGQPRRAVTLYKQIGLAGTSTGDYAAALTAALAANDIPAAESWLRETLAANAHEARILLLAAKVEQARGAPDRAAEFYRASLAATASAENGSRVSTDPRESIEPVRLAVLLAPVETAAAVKPPPPADFLPGRESRVADEQGTPRLRNYVPRYAEGGSAEQEKSTTRAPVPLQIP